MSIEMFTNQKKTPGTYKPTFQSQPVEGYIPAYAPARNRSWKRTDRPQFVYPSIRFPVDGSPGQALWNRPSYRRKK